MCIYDKCTYTDTPYVISYKPLLMKRLPVAQQSAPLLFGGWSHVHVEESDRVSQMDSSMTAGSVLVADIQFLTTNQVFKRNILSINSQN